MIFAKDVYKPIITPNDLINSKAMVSISKYSQVEGNLLAFHYTDSNIKQFREYWDIIKPLLDNSKIRRDQYQIMRNGAYELEFDSKTGHKIVFSFFPDDGGFTLDYYQIANQNEETILVDGQIKNIPSSVRVKEIIALFNN